MHRARYDGYYYVTIAPAVINIIITHTAVIIIIIIIIELPSYRYSLIIKCDYSML